MTVIVVLGNAFHSAICNIFAIAGHSFSWKSFCFEADMATSTALHWLFDLEKFCFEAEMATSTAQPGLS